jgi:hypothetical protein
MHAPDTATSVMLLCNRLDVQCSARQKAALPCHLGCKQRIFKGQQAQQQQAAVASSPPCWTEEYGPYILPACRSVTREILTCLLPIAQPATCTTSPKQQSSTALLAVQTPAGADNRRA